MVEARKAPWQLTVVPSDLGGAACCDSSRRGSTPTAAQLLGRSSREASDAFAQFVAGHKSIRRSMVRVVLLERRQSELGRLRRRGRVAKYSWSMRSCCDPSAPARASLRTPGRCFTGLRASELRGLTREDVNLKTASLTVRQRIDRWNNVGSPKSAGARLTVLLAPLVVNVLREWKLACPKGGWVWHSQTRLATSNGSKPFIAGD